MTANLLSRLQGLTAPDREVDARIADTVATGVFAAALRELMKEVG